MMSQRKTHTLPHIDNIIALAGANWFSTLDLKSGYWQIQLSDEVRCKMAL